MANAEGDSGPMTRTSAPLKPVRTAPAAGPTADRQPHVARSSHIDRLLDTIEAGRPVDQRIFDPLVVLDATVPNWRLVRRGPEAVADIFAQFYADPGHLDQLERQPIDGGELVELTLAWTEDGVAHLAHQVHLLEVADDGRIRRDTMFCGGRWSADLLEEMEAADAQR